jgi:H3 lysine-79-specific histone-lysine N-methyltransferase
MWFSANDRCHCSFELVTAIETQGYEAFDDVIQTVEQVCRHYFSESQAAILLDDVTGYSRRLKRAANVSLDSFSAVLKDFNQMVTKHVSDGTIAQTLMNVHFLPLPLVERILSQTYSRTVSPKVNLLKQYENGTDNVYGELLPRFSHTIFSETRLRSYHVFVDLGSGVGNVVLQAALEVGCESWGIEQMPNPASLATEQLQEFNARCKRYSIKPGKAHLIEGDFLASTVIDNALRRADVVLINNQAFTPELNNKIVMKLLDLKEGCQIISLKSFVPHNWDIKPRNVEDPRNLLRVTKKPYWSDSVSWTNAGGEYFISTKDSTKLRNFLERKR